MTPSCRPGTGAGVHRAVEAPKLAFADREAWYGDAAPVPLAELLCRRIRAARRAWSATGPASSCGPERRAAAPRLPSSYAPSAPTSSTVDAAAEGTAGNGAAGRVSRRWTVDGATRGDTCHVDVVDRWGNMVSATPSGGWLQSSPVIPALGFPLGSRLQMCWLEEGLPSSLIPGRRPRTTLSPTMVHRDGDARAGVRHPRRRPAGPVAARAAAPPSRARARRCRSRSRRRAGTTTASRARSTRATCGRARWSSSRGSVTPSSRTCADAGTG